MARRMLRRDLVPAPLPEPQVQSMTPTRIYPSQKDDASMFMYAPSTVSEEHFIWYAINVWVASAVNRIVESAASAALYIYRRDDVQKYEKHKLLELLGKYGQPNDEQDSFEFFERHYQNYELTGNSIWYWTSASGAPDEVHILDPRYIEIVPGTSRTIATYIYKSSAGREIKIDPANITHFRKANPFSRYWGLSVFEALRLELSSDRNMAKWNEQFFGDGVGIPTGILFVPPDTPDAEMLRVEEESNAKYSGRRRTAVIRGTPGAQSYVPAGAVHRDLDFKEGRFLSRQAVYEALRLPMGMMSESSTEAHARVSQRLFFEAVDERLNRTARKMTGHVLNMWTAWKSYECRFEDTRRDVEDWQQNKFRVETMLLTHSINEVRAKVYNAPAVDWGEKEVEQDATGRPEEADGTSGDAGASSQKPAAADSGLGKAGKQPEPSTGDE
jgi:HK97 family phage portal protein